MQTKLSSPSLKLADNIKNNFRYLTLQVKAPYIRFSVHAAIVQIWVFYIFADRVGTLRERQKSWSKRKKIRRNANKHFSRTENVELEVERKYCGARFRELWKLKITLFYRQPLENLKLNIKTAWNTTLESSIKQFLLCFYGISFHARKNVRVE